LFEQADGYLLVRVQGEWTTDNIKQAIEAVSAEILNIGYTRLLVDARQLSAPRQEYDRFLAGVHIANDLRGIDIAVLYPAELINKFVEDVASNRGARLLVVSELDEALEWLLGR
jgi:hypothetical protein